MAIKIILLVCLDFLLFDALSFCLLDLAKPLFVFVKYFLNIFKYILNKVDFPH